MNKKNNFLLQKDDVGMPKPTVRALPQFGHSYGLPGARDPEGVKNCKYSSLPIERQQNVTVKLILFLSI